MRYRSPNPDNRSAEHEDFHPDLNFMPWFSLLLKTRFPRQREPESYPTLQFGLFFLRQNTRCSLAEIANRLQMSVTAYSNMEAGNDSGSGASTETLEDLRKFSKEMGYPKLTYYVKQLLTLKIGKGQRGRRKGQGIISLTEPEPLNRKTVEHGSKGF